MKARARLSNDIYTDSSVPRLLVFVPNFCRRIVSRRQKGKRSHVLHICISFFSFSCSFCSVHACLLPDFFFFFFIPLDLNPKHGTPVTSFRLRQPLKEPRRTLRLLVRDSSIRVVLVRSCLVRNRVCVRKRRCSRPPPVGPELRITSLVGYCVRFHREN